MDIPAYVISVTDTLARAGFESWIVGGSIRDILIGRRAIDFDVATNALPRQVMGLFRRTVPTGIKHGTVTVLRGHHRVEVTTFRRDGKYSDSRRPDEVEFASSLQEDLSRRDFTINGMAYDPATDTLVDPYAGKEDLKGKLIRTIGDPAERFSEDGLRPYRACRFAAQLGFSIEEATFKAISGCLDHASSVSQERVRDEFVKILQSDTPSVGIELMRESGLIHLFLPELIAGFGVDQNVYHRYDIYHHNLYTCDAADPSDYRIRLAALLHDIGKYYARKEIEEEDREKRSVFYNHEIIGAAITRKIMRRLKFSNNDIKLVTHLIKNHMFHYTNQWTDGAVRRFMRKVGLENLGALFELRRADRIGNGMKRGESRAVNILKKRIERIIEADNAITVKDLAVNGHDIMQGFNLKPGPVVGVVLNHLLEIILDNPEENEREKLLEYAGEYLRSEERGEPQKR
jgi:tRNA nucleotidyltransferase (CCA-adding enzyme)